MDTQPRQLTAWDIARVFRVSPVVLGLGQRGGPYRHRAAWRGRRPKR